MDTPGSALLPPPEASGFGLCTAISSLSLHPLSVCIPWAPATRSVASYNDSLATKTVSKDSQVLGLGLACEWCLKAWLPTEQAVQCQFSFFTCEKWRLSATAIVILNKNTLSSGTSWMTDIIDHCLKCPSTTASPIIQSRSYETPTITIQLPGQ